MEITKKQITIRELTDGYSDEGEDGVFGYSGRLNIRPPFQREFVYGETKRNMVIDTVIKGFPLNIMYWNIKDDDSFEVLDGQQRTISICEYKKNHFSFNGAYFNNQTDDIQEKILNYEIDVYMCKGNDSEKLAWFETVNIAGEVLKKQELRNAVYAGPWLTDAKKKFSKTGCPAYEMGKHLMDGAPIKQDYLEKVLKWISKNNIREYMGKHQHDANANEMWEYYENILKWVESVFGADTRKEMKKTEWGKLFDEFRNIPLNSEEIQKNVSKLMQDEDVQRKSGIYTYVLTNEEKQLNIRAFFKSDKRSAYEKQNGNCVKCCKGFSFDQMEADHITPWGKGGKTKAENCQMLCRDCNRRKSDK